MQHFTISVYSMCEYILRLQLLFVILIGLSHKALLDIFAPLFDLVSFPFFHIFISCSESLCHTTGQPTIGPVLRTHLHQCYILLYTTTTKQHLITQGCTQAADESLRRWTWISTIKCTIFLLKCRKCNMFLRSDGCFKGVVCSVNPVLKWDQWPELNGNLQRDGKLHLQMTMMWEWIPS